MAYHRIRSEKQKPKGAEPSSVDQVEKRAEFERRLAEFRSRNAND